MTPTPPQNACPSCGQPRKSKLLKSESEGIVYGTITLVCVNKTCLVGAVHAG